MARSLASPTFVARVAGLRLLVVLASSASPGALAVPPSSGAPPAATLWPCDAAARGAAQAWSAPPAPGAAAPAPLALAAAPAGALRVVGWPDFAVNTPLATYGAAAGATLFNFTPAGALVTASNVTDAPQGLCLAPLFSVAFPGAPVGAVPCAAGAAAQTWAYSAATGALTSGADAGLCLDFGSTFSCEGPEGKGLPYCDSTLGAGARAADLVARLAPAEIFSLLSANAIVHPMNYGTNLGLPLRGVPNMWYGECCHGAVSECGAAGAAGGSGCPTSFPAGLSTGASLNRSAWAASAAAISTEVRALYNQGLHGLACFAPNVNPFRDGRWGRGPEVHSEDPFLEGEVGAAFSRALQAEGERSVLRALATVKHAVAYDMEDSDGANRASFSANISARDLAEYFLPPFKATTQRAWPRLLMASYNGVNGVPSCANGAFLTATLRDAWGFAGATISDCGGVEGIEQAHRYTNSTSATIAAALGAGLDAECGSYYASYGAQAVADGSVDAAAAAAAATRVLTAWFSAGFMHPASADPYASLGPEAVDSPAARQLALELAVAGTVLLRNDASAASGRPLLPLSAAAIKTLAVIGPHATSTLALLGPYAASSNQVVLNNSIYAALSRRGAAAGFSVVTAEGCASIACPDDSGFAAALATAKSADVVIAAFGLDGSQEGEGRDRKTLALPGRQEDLLNALREAGAAAGSALVLLLAHGGPLALQTAADAAAFPAVLTVFYPGQAGGEAAAAVLFGDVSPAGRSMVSWLPQSWADARLVVDYEMQPHGAVPGATYLWVDPATPLFEFGRGLSYTTFSFAWFGEEDGLAPAALTLDAAALAEGRAAPPHFRVNVTNTGGVASAISVLAFVSGGGAPDEPQEELFDFARAAMLAPGETATLAFSMPLDVLASGRRRPSPPAAPPAAGLGALFVHPGTFSVRIGDTRRSGNFVEAPRALVVTGSAAEVRAHAAAEVSADAR